MYQIRAMWHAWRTGHRPWSDQIFWPGGYGRVWFCDCGEQWWPEGEGVPNWRESTVRRERPE
ncbi:hypothetical protein ACWDZ4_20320 [Streptomyces sp. NPDC003016]